MNDDMRLFLGALVRSLPVALIVFILLVRGSTSWMMTIEIALVSILVGFIVYRFAQPLMRRIRDERYDDPQYRPDEPDRDTEEDDSEQDEQ